MARLFISHSSKDKIIMDSFLEFLQLGMGVERDDIFCTAYAKDLVSGEAFMETIRLELNDCEAVISLVTEEYLRSKFCLAEMGAAYDELLECGISRRRQTAEFTVRLPWFIQQVSQMSDRAMVLSLYKNAGKEYDREYP